MSSSASPEAAAAVAEVAIQAAGQRAAVVTTVCVVGSTDATSPSFTETFGSLRNSLRSENAMWLAASCEVATW